MKTRLVNRRCRVSVLETATGLAHPKTLRQQERFKDSSADFGIALGEPEPGRNGKLFDDSGVYSVN